MLSLAGVPVLKAGADNEYAVVCELRWPAGAAAEAQPQVSHVLKKVGVYAKDKHVQELQHIGEAPEREMQAAIFYTVPEGQELDSVGVRLQAKKSPTWLLSVVRDVMHAQVAICGSGFFRCLLASLHPPLPAPPLLRRPPFACQPPSCPPGRPDCADT